MLLKELLDIDSSPAAGIIPFSIDGACLFMFSSNPDFGGDKPSIAKGRIDKGEIPEETAIREGEEELGLKTSNFINEPFLIYSGKVTGLKRTYHIDVYAVLIENKKDFNEPHYETKSTHWMTREEYNEKGRKSQQKIVELAFDKIEKYLSKITPAK